MKKNYQTPQTEVIQLEGEGLMWTLADAPDAASVHIKPSPSSCITSVWGV